MHSCPPPRPTRPQLKPALRRVWRDTATLQLGVDPSGAVVIGGLDDAAARLIERLDGTRDLPGVFSAAAELGVPESRAGTILDLLTEAGVLADAAADHRSLRDLSQLDRDRLAPDLSAASLVRPGTDGGIAVLARRRASVVAVHGAGRVGASVVTLLAAAGVGSIAVDDVGLTRPADAAPAGLLTDDEGARRQDAALRAARRAAPSVRARTTDDGFPAPRLAVVAPLGAVDEGLVDRLLRTGVPHLFAGVREGTGVVGPLVLPGRSSCRRCHDLRRTERDAAWPTVAAQLASAGVGRAMPCDVVLATAVAACTALQVLAFLDLDPQDGPPATDILPTVDGTLEIAQADGRVRRRSWSPHPLCGCHWPGR